MKLLELARSGERFSVLCRSAHADDIEIGVGATILGWIARGVRLVNVHRSNTYCTNHHKRSLYGLWGRAKLNETYELVSFTRYRIFKTTSECDIGKVVGKRPLLAYTPALRDCLRAHQIGLGWPTRALFRLNQSDCLNWVERGDRARIQRRESSP